MKIQLRFGKVNRNRNHLRIDVELERVRVVYHVLHRVPELLLLRRTERDVEPRGCPRGYHLAGWGRTAEFRTVIHFQSDEDVGGEVVVHREGLDGLRADANAPK